MEEELFEMWEFRFVDKKSGMKLVVYARYEETAKEIAEPWNENQHTYHWVKKRFRYKKKCFSKIPPYELEQMRYAYFDYLKK